MDKSEIISKLRAEESELRARGVLHAALFGSRARGDHRPDSDIDILIDIEPETIRDVYAYVGVKSYIADLFPGPVDVVDRQGLKPQVKPPAESEAVYAFQGSRPRPPAARCPGQYPPCSAIRGWTNIRAILG